MHCVNVKKVAEDLEGFKLLEERLLTGEASRSTVSFNVWSTFEDRCQRSFDEFVARCSSAFKGTEIQVHDISLMRYNEVHCFSCVVNKHQETEILERIQAIRSSSFFKVQCPFSSSYSNPASQDQFQQSTLLRLLTREEPNQLILKLVRYLSHDLKVSVLEINHERIEGLQQLSTTPLEVVYKVEIVLQSPSDLSLNQRLGDFFKDVETWTNSNICNDVCNDVCVTHPYEHSEPHVKPRGLVVIDLADILQVQPACNRQLDSGEPVWSEEYAVERYDPNLENYSVLVKDFSVLASLDVNNFDEYFNLFILAENAFLVCRSLKLLGYRVVLNSAQQGEFEFASNLIAEYLGIDQVLFDENTEVLHTARWVELLQNKFSISKENTFLFTIAGNMLQDCGTAVRADFKQPHGLLKVLLMMGLEAQEILQLHRCWTETYGKLLPSGTPTLANVLKLLKDNPLKPDKPFNLGPLNDFAVAVSPALLENKVSTSQSRITIYIHDGVFNDRLVEFLLSDGVSLLSVRQVRIQNTLTPVIEILIPRVSRHWCNHSYFHGQLGFLQSCDNESLNFDSCCSQCLRRLRTTTVLKQFAIAMDDSAALVTITVESKYAEELRTEDQHPLDVTLYGLQPLSVSTCFSVMEEIIANGLSIESISLLSDPEDSSTVCAQIKTIAHVSLKELADLPNRESLINVNLRRVTSGDFDIFLQKRSVFRRARRLVVFDLDSTLIEQEVIDELAAEAGVGDQVSELTAKAMRGEINFLESLTARVGMLKGLPLSALEKVAQRIEFTPGAKLLCATLRSWGFGLAVISGGFSFFANRVKADLNLHHAFSNELAVDPETGALLGIIDGSPVTAEKKAELVEMVAAIEQCVQEQVVVVGDGANDIPMLLKAGTGVAFCGKPAVQQAADVQINWHDLTGVLYLLGIPIRTAKRWVQTNN